MPFEKGKSGNPLGRPVGNSKSHKAAREQREFLHKLLLQNRGRFEKTLEDIDDKAFVRAYMEMLHYIMPRPSPAILSDTPDLETFLKMTPEERMEVIKNLQSLLSHDQA